MAKSFRYGSVLRDTNCYAVVTFSRGYSERRRVYNMRQMADAVNDVVSRGGRVLSIIPEFDNPRRDRYLTHRDLDSMGPF